MNGRAPENSPALSVAELTLVAEQLWPGYAAPAVRITTDASPDSEWVATEQFRYVGRRRRIDLIIPADRVAAARALVAYSGLRPPAQRLARLALAAGVVAGFMPRRLVALQHSRTDPAPDTVLDRLRRFLGHDVDGAMHVRRTANRKALLQIVDRRGKTCGFAKIARDTVSSDGIRKETEMLERLSGGAAPVRTPRVLTAGEVGDYPYVLTEPLPRDIRRVGSGLVDVPTVSEFAALAPITRRGRAGSTGHVQRMLDRADRLRQIDAVADSLQPLTELLQRIADSDDVMQISAWWHGDFAFWNTGRGPDGTLWCWDFENVEHDALTGLDVVHWHASRRREHAGASGVADRVGILLDAAPTLRALGVAAPDKLRVLYQTYTAEIVLRTWETAASDGWSRTWTTRAELDALTASAMGR